MDKKELTAAFDSITPTDKTLDKILDRTLNTPVQAEPIKMRSPLRGLIPLAAAAVVLAVGSVIAFNALQHDPVEPFSETTASFESSPQEPIETTTHSAEHQPGMFFDIKTNTFHLDVRMFELYGDENFMYATVELIGKNGFVFDENEYYYSSYMLFMQEQRVILEQRDDEEKYPGVAMTSQHQYVKDGRLYLEFVISDPYNVIVGETIRIVLKDIKVLDEERLMQDSLYAETGIIQFKEEHFFTVLGGEFSATFTADYDPVEFEVTEINETLYIGGNAVILNSVKLSKHSINFHFSDLDEKSIQNFNTRIEIKFYDGSTGTVSPYMPEDYLTHGHGYSTEVDNSGKCQYFKSIAFIEGFDTSGIAAVIINGNEFVLIEKVLPLISDSNVPPSSYKFMFPVSDGIFSVGYGYNNGSFHYGVDIEADLGSPIFAAVGGTVVTAEYDNGGYGHMIIIDHGDGYSTLYAHCNELYVSEGDEVVAGQHIADVGSTGHSIGPHLHFEIIFNGEKLNPMDYLG
ncbi:MAG: M23 family metallopeptidase [Oscillospiraceae bacterium]|nr:M23 family metallopeptidase [Oscillospiraceae bacterium]